MTDVRIFYTDEENDDIFVGSDDEYKELLKVATLKNKVLVVVFILSVQANPFSPGGLPSGGELPRSGQEEQSLQEGEENGPAGSRLQDLPGESDEVLD